MSSSPYPPPPSPSRPSPSWGLARWGLVCAAAGIALVAGGGLSSCVDPNALGDGEGSEEEGTPPLEVDIPEDGPCNDGDARDCGVEQGITDGKLTCGLGLQFCRDGEWSGCFLDASKGAKRLPVPKTTRLIPLPDSPSPIRGRVDLAEKLLVTGGASTRCDNNPCNPYCWVYSDVPASPYTAGTIATTLPYNASVQTLAGSNVNSAYKTSGSNSSACSSTPNSACQFDQHCATSNSTTTCTAFGISEQNSCAGAGADVTVPPTCNDSASAPTLRAISVCNRGSTSVAAGVQCYTFPSGTSVTMGTSAPDLSNAVYLGATSSSLAAGTCTTLWVDNTGGRACSSNAQCGSGTCSSGTCTGTANFHISATQLIVCNPQSGGSAITTVPSSGGNGPSASSNVVGTWANTAGSTTTSNVATAVATASDSNEAITTPAASSTNSIAFGNFGFTLPSEATVNTIRTTVRWKMHSPPGSANLSVQAYTAGGSTAIGTAASVSSSSIPTTYATAVQTASGLQLTSSQLSDGQFVVKVQVSR